MRLELPDGNWWELRDTVTWGMRKAFRLAALRAGAAVLGDNGKVDMTAWKKALLAHGDLDLSALDDAYLLYGTAAWSWPESVTAISIDGRTDSDTAKVLAKAIELYGVTSENPFETPSPV